MDLNDDFDLSEFLILDEEDPYTSSCNDELQKPIAKACSPLTPPETPFDIHVADIKEKKERSNDGPWPSTAWDAAYNNMIHPLQQAASTSDTVCPLSIMLSPSTSSSSTSSDPTSPRHKDKEPIDLFPNLPHVEETNTIKVSGRQRDDTKGSCPKVATPPAIKKLRNTRTPTSYDTKTSDFLKRMFFETYVQNKKLTKEQRQKIIDRTDLDSRKITYWFSNHKRRSKDLLETYARLLRQGTITTYDEFVHYCKDSDVPGFHPQST